MGLFDKAKKIISENISEQIQQAQSSIVDKLSEVNKGRQNQNSEIESLRSQLKEAYNEINALKSLLKEKDSVIASYKRNENKPAPSSHSQESKVAKDSSGKKNSVDGATPKGRDVTPDFIEMTSREMCSELKDYGETVTKELISTLDEITDKIERSYTEGISRIESIASGLDEISEKKAETLIAKVKTIESNTMEEVKSLGKIDSIIESAYNKVQERKREIIKRLSAIAKIGEEYIKEIESQDLTASYDIYDISSAYDSAEIDIDSAYDDAVDTIKDIDNGIYIGINCDVNGKISDAEFELDSAVSSAEDDIRFAIG